MYEVVAGYELIGISKDDVFALESLQIIEGPIKHNAPFDRILISQTLSNNLTLITCDKKMGLYGLKNIEVM